MLPWYVYHCDGDDDDHDVYSTDEITGKHSTGHACYGWCGVRSDGDEDDDTFTFARFPGIPPAVTINKL